MANILNQTNLKFTKMHGLGNDFMVINATSAPMTLSTQQIQQWSDRHTGIGFDQLLLLEKARHSEEDFYYRIFNADGHEVAQCGNGARCMGQFILDQHLSTKKAWILGTQTGRVLVSQTQQELITVDMGAPIFESAAIPFWGIPHELVQEFALADRNVQGAVLSMGNPHVVIIVDDIQAAPVATIGALLQAHPWFPESVNVGFMQIIDRQQIKLRVFERGVGETLACASGACAAVVAGIQQGLLDAVVSVELPGGLLSIQWAGNSATVLQTGPAIRVFEGQIGLPCRPSASSQ